MNSTLSIIAERLNRSEIFADLDKADLMAIAEFSHEETYQDGTVVLSEEDPANIILIVERGKLALEKLVQLGRHSTPRNATIGYVGPGELAGFSTIASPHVYSTSVVCVEPTRVITIDGTKLRKYLQEHPEAGYKVLSSLTTLVGGRYRNAINTLTYFLSIVSHELRSPLAAVENYLRTMLGGFAGDLNLKQERMVKRSILRVTELSTLIGDVVDLARMRPEQIQADFEWFDPGEAGTQSIEDARLAASEKDIRLQIHPPPKFEPLVGARRRMRQVFTNLLNNAIKFAPPETTVFFRAWYEPDAVFFEVEDEGPGIPQEDMDNIFKDFYRASNVGEETGSGLGLSISKKIMDAHDGDILVKNKTDEEGNITGTKFTVRIPRNLLTPEMRRSRWINEEDEQ